MHSHLGQCHLEGEAGRESGGGGVEANLRLQRIRGLPASRAGPALAIHGMRKRVLGASFRGPVSLLEKKHRWMETDLRP